MTTHYYLNIENIKRIMQEKRFTEEQLAEKMNVSKRRLHGFLTGKLYNRIPFKIYYGLAVALNLSFYEVITDKPPADKA